MNKHSEKGMFGNAARRYPRYFRYLRDLLLNGVMKVSSAQIAEHIGIAPSQVRSDLAAFAGAGQQGYGYNVKLLYTEISRELGAGDGMRAVIIGGDEPDFKRLSRWLEGRGVQVICQFTDNDGEYQEVRRYHESELCQRLGEEKADIALIISFPEGVENFPLCLQELGVRGVWNLSQRDISLSVPVINLPIGDIVMSLCYEVRNFGKEDSV